MSKQQKPVNTPQIADEPGWQDCFQRGLQRAFNTPPTHRTKPARASGKFANGRANKRTRRS